VDLNEDNLRKWLQNPDEVKPGNRMAELAAAYNDPALQLSQRDIDALVAYLLSRKPAAPAK
jgi:cytochrome c2